MWVFSQRNHAVQRAPEDSAGANKKGTQREFPRASLLARRRPVQPSADFRGYQRSPNAHIGWSSAFGLHRVSTRRAQRKAKTNTRSVGPRPLKLRPPLRPGPVGSRRTNFRKHLVEVPQQHVGGHSTSSFSADATCHPLQNPSPFPQNHLRVRTLRGGGPMSQVKGRGWWRRHNQVTPAEPPTL